MSSMFSRLTWTFSLLDGMKSENSKDVSDLNSFGKHIKIFCLHVLISRDIFSICDIDAKSLQFLCKFFLTLVSADSPSVSLKLVCVGVKFIDRDVILRSLKLRADFVVSLSSALYDIR